MALKIQISLSNGITLNDAYACITTVLLQRQINDVPRCDIYVTIYKDQDARNSGKVEVTQFLHTVTGEVFETYFSEDALKDEGVSLLSQAYSYLKTLPAYVNSEDV